MGSAGINGLFSFGFSNLNRNLVKLFSYGLKNCICVVGLLMDLFKVIKFDSIIPLIPGKAGSKTQLNKTQIVYYLY